MLIFILCIRTKNSILILRMGTKNTHFSAIQFDSMTWGRGKNPYIFLIYRINKYLINFLQPQW